MLDINTVDIIVFVVLVLSCLLGVVRGFTREFFGIASWIGAIFIMLYTLPFLRPFAAQYIKNELFADIVVGFVIFALALAVLGMITKFASGKIKGSVLGGLDRSLGLVFGVFRAWTLFALAYITAAFLVSPDQFPSAVKAAKSTPFIEAGANLLRKMVPEDAVKNVQMAIKPGKATREQPPISKVVAALSHPLPKILEPSKPGPVTNRLTDIKGL